MSIKVVIADDHEVVRRGLVSLLAGSEIKIVGEAASGDEAVKLTKKFKPDVVLLDIRMAGKDGLSALEKIRNDMPGVRCVMLSTFDNPTYVARAVAAGAHDYMLKGCTRAELITSITGAAAGQLPMRAGELRRVATTMANRVAVPDPDIPLTQRETQVLRHMAPRHARADPAGPAVLGAVRPLRGRGHRARGQHRHRDDRHPRRCLPRYAPRLSCGV